MSFKNTSTDDNFLKNTYSYKKGNKQQLDLLNFTE